MTDLQPPVRTTGAEPKTEAASPTTNVQAKSSGEADPKKKETIRARHVLVQYMGAERAEKSVVRTKEQALAVAQEVARRARAGEDLGRLAVEFSDEPGAAARGGSLGTFPRGQMVRAFDDVAFTLEVGQISGVVETGFGYHVIQRLE